MPIVEAAQAAWPEASWMNVQTGARDVTHVEAGLAALAVRREVQRGYRTSAGSFYRDIVFATLGLHFLTRTQRKELMTRVMMRNCGMEEDSDGVESFALGSNHDTAQWTHPVTGAPLLLEDRQACFKECRAAFPAATPQQILLAMRANLAFARVLSPACAFCPMGIPGHGCRCGSCARRAVTYVHGVQ